MNVFLVNHEICGVGMDQSKGGDARPLVDGKRGAGELGEGIEDHGNGPVPDQDNEVTDKHSEETTEDSVTSNNMTQFFNGNAH